MAGENKTQVNPELDKKLYIEPEAFALFANLHGNKMDKGKRDKFFANFGEALDDNTCITGKGVVDAMQKAGWSNTEASVCLATIFESGNKWCAVDRVEKDEIIGHRDSKTLYSVYTEMRKYCDNQIPKTKEEVENAKKGPFKAGNQRE